MNKPRLDAITYVRAFAILGVLLIHSTSQTLVSVTPGTLTHTVFLYVNKMSNFAVPVFVLLSAMVLFYRYDQPFSLTQIRSFYRKRLAYIVVPYVIWSVLYQLYYTCLLPFIKGEAWRWDFLNMLKLLLTGQAAPHLYFFFILFQFYLLFPVLMMLAQRWRQRPYLWILFGITVQCVFYAITYVYAQQVGPVPYRATYMFGYMGLIAIGGYIGMTYPVVRRRLQKYGLAVTLLTLVVGIAYSTVFYWAYAGVYRAPTVLFDASFHLYALLAALTLLYAAERMAARPAEHGRNKLLFQLGVHSFGIYLTHVAVLDLLRRALEAPGHTLLYQVYVWLLFAIALVIPWLTVKWLRPQKHSWLLLGK
ncbi:acyltransferase [Marinicrinis sediminis]|uniref:Acyltransferase n=1 Tax=Marinicrinis sediminis TaxID=1652465 RepID=A0ABW5RGM0_9BACL